MPAWSMGKEKRSILLSHHFRLAEMKSKAKVPGPGQYASETQTGHDSSPKWSMGHSKRETLGPARNVPGPGAYSTLQSV